MHTLVSMIHVYMWSWMRMKVDQVCKNKHNFHRTLQYDYKPSRQNISTPRYYSSHNIQYKFMWMRDSISRIS